MSRIKQDKDSCKPCLPLYPYLKIISKGKHSEYGNFTKAVVKLSLKHKRPLSTIKYTVGFLFISCISTGTESTSFCQLKKLS